MIQVIDGFKVGTSLPIDNRYIKQDKTEALNSIIKEERYRGLQITLLDDGNGATSLWWFRDGIKDEDFVPFLGDIETILDDIIGE